MAIFIVREDDKDHTYFDNSDEAYKYLEELKLVHPDVEWSIEHPMMGRLEHHKLGSLWGYEAVYDIVEQELHANIQAWVWKSQCNWRQMFEARVKTCMGIDHDREFDINRFVPVYGDGPIELNKVKNYFESHYQLMGSDDLSVTLKKKS